MRTILAASAFAAAVVAGCEYARWLSEEQPAAPHTKVADMYVPTVTQPFIPLRGDDNADGVIDEDESGWDCRIMGNRICGEDGR